MRSYHSTAVRRTRTKAIPPMNSYSYQKSHPRYLSSSPFLPSLRYIYQHHFDPSNQLLITSFLQPSSWLRTMTDDYSNPNCPIKIAHGTTTLAFRFQGGIIVCTDSRATAGNWIASQTVKKVIEINNCLLGTMAGGAAVCSPHKLHWKRRWTGLILMLGLPILACVLGNAVSATRAQTQAPHLRRSRIQDSRQPCLLVQGHGSQHGMFAFWDAKLAMA